MKYRILLMGNNKILINAFFAYMDKYFACFVTSDRYDDVINHVKYIQPDALVYCLYGEQPDDLQRFVNVGRKLEEEGIPVIIVANRDDCREFTQFAPLIKVKMFQSPITNQDLEEGIHGFLGKRQRKTGEGRRFVAVPESAAKIEDVMRAAQELLAQIAKEEAQEAKKNKRKHILIVDDDSSTLKLLKGYLAERYDVATAIGGKAALKFLESKPTDLVLLDDEMAEGNGAAVLEKMRENPKTKNLPVVFLTDMAEHRKLKEALSGKVQGYLTKPIDMEKLSSTIKGVLD